MNMNALRLGSEPDCSALLVLFELLVETPEAERPMILARVGGLFPDLHQALTRMLDSSGELASSSFQSDGPAAPVFQDGITDSSKWIEVIFPEFTRVKPLADQGGMSRVFEAIRRNDQKRCVLKFPGNGPKLEDRFQAEIMHLKSIKRKNIVEILEVLVINQKRVGFVMTFYDGGTLAAVGKVTDVRSAAVWIKELATALEYTHVRGIIHRDIKPQNVLFDGKTPILCDFGLARLVQRTEKLTTDGGRVGTPKFMSPEQARGSTDLTISVDIYGLGALLFYLLTGETPVCGENDQEIFHNAIIAVRRSPRSYDAAIPEPLSYICSKCLSLSPDDRYSRASELADDLQRYLEGKRLKRPGCLGVALKRCRQTLDRTVGECRRRPWIVGLFAFLIVLGAGGVRWWQMEKVNREFPNSIAASYGNRCPASPWNPPLEKEIEVLPSVLSFSLEGF